MPETESPCGRSLETMHGLLVCVLAADHTEYHADKDGLPFGPWRERVSPSAMTTQPPAAPETETDANGLTEAEREAWDVDPDLWPHTPPLHIFRALMDEDDNLWWRASGGHGLNAYDAAIERIDELAERVRVVEGERDEWKSRAFAAVARAESAEAAREAEKAAHERLRAEMRTLADEAPENFTPRLGDAGVYASDLRALLGGGGAR